MNFEMVGKLRLGRESDKFHPYQERQFDSGWMNRTLMFNAVCGDNRHMLTIQGGTYPDRKDYKIVTFGPAMRTDDGGWSAGERLEIPWKDRKLPANIEKVAESRKFIVDLEKHGRRLLLQRAADKLHDGTGLTDEDLKKIGLADESEVEDALEESNKKRHEFISAWDQAEFVKKVIDSGKYDNVDFYIRGTCDRQYSDAKDQWYDSLVPQRIYLAGDDAEEHSTGNAVMYFGSDAIDDGSLEDKGKYYINGYTMEYNSARKKKIPAPFQIVIDASDKDEKAQKLAARKLVKFKVEGDEIKEYGVAFDMLNGSQRVEITEDMLTEDEREDLECGLITMDDLRREYGGSVYGDRVQEYRFTGPIRGYAKGSKETAYREDDMVIQPLNNDDEDEDLFDEDDL